MDFKVRGLEFKSVQNNNNKKNTAGAWSRDRARGSIRLGIGIGLGRVNRVRNWDGVRAGDE